MALRTHPAAVLIAGLVILPALGLLSWAWIATVEIEGELRSFNGFDGLHLDV